MSSPPIGPICLDASWGPSDGPKGKPQHPNGETCGRLATFEVRSPLDGSYGAYCDLCVRAWSRSLVRRLTSARTWQHLQAQLQAKTLVLAWPPDESVDSKEVKR